MSEVWRYAVTRNGILNATVDRMWDSPHFQFYMGDLANVVPGAKTYQASDSIYASCHWDGNEDAMKFEKYDGINQVYVQAGINCTIKHYSQ